MSANNNRERAERLNDLAALLQEESMKLILQKVRDGTASSADLKLAMDTADKSGLVLDPSAFPTTLKDKLTKTVNPKKFSEGDPDTAESIQ